MSSTMRARVAKPRPDAHLLDLGAIFAGHVDRPQHRRADTARLAGIAAEAIFDAFSWSETKEGGTFWSYVYARLGEIAEAAAEADKETSRAGYLSPCPVGYGTVLGHMVQQGKEPEDAGLREGVRLARIAKELGTPSMWVSTGPALAMICERVRAYPADFLRTYLGPVDPAFEIPEAQRPRI